MPRITEKSWLIEFLFCREIFKGPDGRPLYKYQVTEPEYQILNNMLCSSFGFRLDTANPHFAACFCLFVSEQYRRDYNGIWSWAGAEEALGVSLNQLQHA